MTIEANAARAAARFGKTMEVALTEVGLSLPQYRLLAFLSGGPERATALAGWLDVSPPSLTALVDGCVARGLVERVTLPEDRRCVRHVITTAGFDALASADAVLTTKIASLASFLPTGQARRMTEGLELLGKAMDFAGEAKTAATAAAAASAAAASAVPAGSKS